MRIAVANWNRRRIGGAETYIADLLPDLVAAGNDVALWSQLDQDQARPPIGLPEGAVEWCAETMGTEPAFAALRAWRPDVVFAHGVDDASFEAPLTAIAPSVFLAHGYYGTCISGTKAFQRPDHRPCERRFGAACLAMYFPRRCGGRNPLTMLRDFELGKRRLSALAAYDQIVTLSEHIREEILRHGFAADRVHKVPYLAIGEGERPPEPAPDPRRAAPERWELVYAGRFGGNKGGTTLIDALPLVRDAVRRPVRVTFAGDGPEREAWSAAAARVSRANAGIDFVFTGWMTPELLAARFASSHLLVVPSLWPEPLGLVGIEAARAGLPAAAFDVGGIGEWLLPGVSGALAPGDPSTARGLASAIAACLADPETHARLSVGARWVADHWDRRRHVAGILEVLERAAHRERAPEER